MKRMAMFVICLLLCSTQVMALDLFSTQTTDGEQQIRHALDGEAQSILAGTSTEADLLENLAILMKNTKQEQTGAVRQALSSLSRIAIILILCSCAAGFSNHLEITPFLLSLAGALGISMAVFGDLSGMMRICTETAEQIRILSKSILPVMLTAVTVSGSPAAASASYTGTMLALDFCISLITDALIPAVSAYIAMIAVNAALANHMLTRLALFLKWLTVSSLKLLVTIFFSYIAIAGTVSHGMDAVAVKTAKFALNGSVPVVGGILSGATDSVLAGAAVLKNTLGLFGMLCVAAVCIVPFLRVGISYLIFRVGTAVLSPICSTQLAGLLDGIADSIGLILGMLGSCSAILFFELVYSVVMVT